MRKLLCTISLLAWLAPVAASQSVSVADAMTITAFAGEAQSTVVPPGKKQQQCPRGRFLVSNDQVRPPGSVVSGRDLDQTSGAPVASKFDMGTLAANYDDDYTKSKYFFGTNDHDLVTLSNGDVLYITGAFSRMPMGRGRPGFGGIPAVAPPDPAWFKKTSRDLCAKKDAADNCTEWYPFGPNARSVVLTFRSTDCGENFTFVSEMDPVRHGGGTCALPQKKGDPSTSSYAYDMGGTDGQLVKVDPANDRIYLNFQCVGYNPDPSKLPDYVLDPNGKINKTLVLLSETGGASWRALGYLDVAQWRFGVVPLDGDELAFGYSNSIIGGRRVAGGKYVFDDEGVAAPEGQFSWMGWWDFSNTTVPLTQKRGNVFGIPVVARTRDSKSVVLAFPDKTPAGVYGYRVYFFDRARGQLCSPEGPDAWILPATRSAGNIAFHLAVADPGTGPLLLYWTDMDSAAKTLTVRGRLITGRGEFTEDFTISRQAGADHSFALGGNWYGDYHTAGAFMRRVGQAAGQAPFVVDSRTSRYEFYPMWVESDGIVHYTRVEYAVDPTMLATTALAKARPVRIIAVPAHGCRPQPPPLQIKRVRHPPRDVPREPDVRDALRPARPTGPVVIRPRPAGPVVIRPRP